MLLLGANHVIPVTRLVAATWGENPPSTATHQIRKVIAELRHRLPGAAELIVTDGPGYRIVLDDDQLDLSMFGIRIGQARKAVADGSTRYAVAELRGALGLWRGPLIGGAGSAVIEAASRSLEEQRLTATGQLLDLRLSLGEDAELISELTALIQEYPLREMLRGQLMLALWRCGRQAEALEEYSRVRRLLADELGIDPSPGLDRIHEAILCKRSDLEAAPRFGGDQAEPVVGSTAVPQCSLPYDLADFTGRTKELGSLLLEVKNPIGQGMRIIVIDGMGGSGKTALAIHTAHQLEGRYPDGQLYVDLNGFTAGRAALTPRAVLGTLLRTSGLTGVRIPHDDHGRSALWRVVTAQRRLLILLDNAIDEAQVRPLLPGAAGCLVLITSRSQLADLDGAFSLSVAMMTHEDCVTMLERTVGLDRVAAEPAAVDLLITLCGHLPLAVRICASRLRNRQQWSIGYLAGRLQSETGVLDELCSRSRSVAAAIRLSHQPLDQRHRTAFRLLGQHVAADFDLKAAVGLIGSTAADAESILERLVDVRLLEAHAFGRYGFHNLVRSFARGNESA